jgi:thioesterase domain-containing protein
MIPATVTALPALPRTERGKVDRQALPAPATGPARSGVPRTQWEVLLADLWTRVLELEEIGVDDDFVELGGDSLAAEQLRALVREELGIVLPATALIDAPTLAEFARKVSVADRCGPAHPTVVPLRAHGSRPPLFCVAGAAGLALGFVSLARRLGEDQPVYGFQAHGLERRGLPDWTVERMARRHLQVLRVIQPYGPYYLAGHSMGGLVALELAQQLAAAGEEVALLALVDTYLPASLRTAEGSGDQPADPGTAAAQPGAAGGPGAAVARGYRRRAAIPARLRSIGRALLPEQRRNLLRRETLRRMAQLPLTGLLTLPGGDGFEAFFQQSRMLERFYRPRPWAGRALVFRAMHHPDPPAAWSRYLTGSHDDRELATEHFSVLREPHILTIADAIRTEMDQLIAAREEAGRRL